MTTTTVEATQSRPRTAAQESIEIFKTIVSALLIALVLRVVVFQPYTIPSGSMEPGLQEGDYIIVSKFNYGWSRYSIPLGLPLFKGRVFGHAPARGDIVTLALPREPKVTYIKRVIGLPGDRVQVTGGVVFVNAVPIPRAPAGAGRDDPGIPGLTVYPWRETMANGKSYITFDQGAGREVDDTAVYTVPQGQYFVMGDNRDNSLDSRYPRAIGVGFVPAENLVGKAQMIMVSWKPGASLMKPWTWLNLDTRRLFRKLS